MIIPTFVIVPLFIIAFVVLAIENYVARPDRQFRDTRFLMMLAAVVLMLAQILLGPAVPWLSLPLFVLALVWTFVAFLLMSRRLAAR